jgi:hypothetical protein
MLTIFTAILLLGIAAPLAKAACPPICLVVTNADVPTPGFNSTSIFTTVNCGPMICPDVSNPSSTGSDSIGSSYFAIPQQAVAVYPTKACIFVGDAVGGGGAGPSDIAVFSITGTSPNWSVSAPTRYVAPHNPPDSGAAYGLGIVIHGSYLYANYTAGTTDPAVGPGGNGGTIGVWKINGKCKMNFLTSIAASSSGGGIYGGPIDGMTVTPAGMTLLTAYADGSVGTYGLTAATSFIAQGKQYTTLAYTQTSNTALATSVAAVQGPSTLWAIFDNADYPPPGALFDVFTVNDVAHTLAADTTYTPTRGEIIDSNTFVVSPNAKYLYAAGAVSGSMQTETFNDVTGVIGGAGCLDVTMRGAGGLWEYLAIDAVETSSLSVDSGNGNFLFVAEAGFGFSGGASYIGGLYIKPNGCLTEAGLSPQLDPSTPYLTSISTVTGNPSQ